MRGRRDLEGASVGAVVCALVAVLVPFEIVRAIAALPLTLFLPGYAIVALSFAPGALAPPKLATLSVGISLMVLALGALLLNVFPFGLTTVSWAVLLVVVIVACCRGAALRHGGRGSRLLLPSSWRPSPRDRVLVAAAAVIAIAALVLAQKPLPAKHAEGFTALWMVPTDSREEAVQVGVLSSEQDPASYSLQVTVGGKSTPQSFRVALDPGGEETFEVPVPRAAKGRVPVVASLYLSDRPKHLYRRVTSWLPRQTTFPQSP